MSKAIASRQIVVASFLALAGLLAGTGADCEEFGVLDPANSGLLEHASTSTSGPIADAVNGTPAPVPELSVGASATQVNVGESVALAATVTGGTPPYYYYWMVQGGGWTLV